jgi:hypothetical protein
MAEIGSTAGEAVPRGLVKRRQVDIGSDVLREDPVKGIEQSDTLRADPVVEGQVCDDG